MNMQRHVHELHPSSCFGVITVCMCQCDNLYTTPLLPLVPPCKRWHNAQMQQHVHYTSVTACASLQEVAYCIRNSCTRHCICMSAISFLSLVFLPKQLCGLRPCTTDACACRCTCMNVIPFLPPVFLLKRPCGPRRPHLEVVHPWCVRDSLLLPDHDTSFGPVHCFWRWWLPCHLHDVWQYSYDCLHQP